MTTDNIVLKPGTVYRLNSEDGRWLYIITTISVDSNIVEYKWRYDNDGHDRTWHTSRRDIPDIIAILSRRKIEILDIKLDELEL